MALDTDLPLNWTVSRCFRRLRPLTSRCTLLRLEHQVQLSSARPAPPRPNGSRPEFGDSPDPSRDPDWMDQPRAQARPRKYARTNPSDSIRDRTADDSLSLPTPMISRLREGLDLSSPVQVSAAESVIVDHAGNKESSSASDPSHLPQQFAKIFTDFMESTSDDGVLESTTGVGSLRAMCCRKYGRMIIALEEEVRNAQFAEEKFDVATQAYNLVEEALGAQLAANYLGGILREHALALAEDMISTGCLPQAEANGIIRRMGKKASRRHIIRRREIESIAKVLVKKPEKPCCFERSLATIPEYLSIWEKKSKPEFEIRLLTTLFDGHFPITWLGSRRMSRLWTCLFKSLVNSSESVSRRVSAVRDVTVFLQRLLRKLASESLEPALHASAKAFAGECFNCEIQDPRPRGILRMGGTWKRDMFVPPPNATQNTQGAFASLLVIAVSRFCSMLSSIIISASIEPKLLPTIPAAALMELLVEVSAGILYLKSKQPDLIQRIAHGCFTSIIGATTLCQLVLRSEAAGTSSLPMGHLVGSLSFLEDLNDGNHHGNGFVTWLLPEIMFSTMWHCIRLMRPIEDSDVLSKFIKAFSSDNEAFAEIPTESQLLLSRVAECALAKISISVSPVAQEMVMECRKKLKRQLRVVHAPKLPKIQDFKQSYHWETSICEWVARLPGHRPTSKDGSKGQKVALPSRHSDPTQQPNVIEGSQPPPRTNVDHRSSSQHHETEIESDEDIDAEEAEDDTDEMEVEEGAHEDNSPFMDRHEAPGLSQLLMTPDSLTASSPTFVRSLAASDVASKGIGTLSSDKPNNDPEKKTNFRSDAWLTNPMSRKRKAAYDGDNAKRSKNPGLDDEEDESDELDTQPAAKRRTRELRFDALEISRDDRRKARTSSSIAMTDEEVKPNPPAASSALRRRNPRGQSLLSLSSATPPPSGEADEPEDELGFGRG